MEAGPHWERCASGLWRDLGDDEEDADTLRHDEHCGEDRSEGLPTPHALHRGNLARVVTGHAKRVIRKGANGEEARKNLQPPVHALDVDVPVDPRMRLLQH